MCFLSILKLRFFRTVIAVSMALNLGLASGQAQSSHSYPSELREWRANRIAALRAPQGWLSLAGLLWLKEGDNSFGSDAGNKVVFPAAAPARVGAFRLQNDSVWMSALPEAGVQFQNKPVTELLLWPANAMPNMGRFSWVVIKRGTQYGVRLWDAEHPNLQGFEHIPHFPVRKKWRIPARFEAYSEPRILLVPNILGMNIEQQSPGVLHFKVSGRDLQIPVLEEGPESFFLVFADATTGAETYGGGRYLSVAKPGPDGQTHIDFNKAYLPPCAFTPFATCLLPPADHRLPVVIRAGEKNYGSH